MGNDVSVRSCVGPTKEELEELHGLQKEINNRKTRIDELEREVKETRQQEQKTVTEFKYTEKQRQQLEASVEELKKNHEAVLKSLRGQLEKGHEEKTEAETRVKQLEETFDLMNEEKEKIQGALDEERQAKQQLQEELAKAREEVAALSEKLVEAEKKAQAPAPAKQPEPEREPEPEPEPEPNAEPGGDDEDVPPDAEHKEEPERDVRTPPQGALSEMMFTAVTVSDLPQGTTATVQIGEAKHTNPATFLTEKTMPTATITVVSDVKSELVGELTFNLPKSNGVVQEAYTYKLAKSSISVGVKLHVRPVPQLTLLWKEGWLDPDEDASLADVLALTKVDLNAHERNKWTPLMNAIARRQSKVALTLIHSGRVDVTARDEDEGLTALHFAAVYGELAVAKLLVLKPGVGVDETDSKKRTPLAHAAKSGQVPLARFLLEENGANVDMRDMDGLSPLMHACFEGHVEMAELLIDKRADIAGALSVCALRDHAEVVKVLLTKGKADANTRDGNQMTPLMICALRGCGAAARVLAENGADVNAVDEQHRSAIVFAAKRRDGPTTKLLLEFGADPAAQTLAGESAFSLAKGDSKFSKKLKKWAKKARKK